MAKGNFPGAVKLTIVGLVAGALLAPSYMKWAFGQSIEIPLNKTLTQIMVVVFVPLMLGWLTQYLLIRRHGQKAFAENWKPKIIPWGTLGVLGVVFTATALKAKDLAARPDLLISLGVPVILFYLINFTLSTLFARLCKNQENGIAFVYGTALRNLSIALAIALAVFGKQASVVALLISLGFIAQTQLAAWHVRLIHRLLPVGGKA